MTILLVTAFSGCFQGDSDGPDGPDMSIDPTAPGGWATSAIFGEGVDPAATGSVVDHDHSDRSIHKGLSTPNFRFTGWDPLTTDQHGMSAGGYYCGEVSHEGDRKLAVVNSFTSQVALVVVDVTDPSAPEKVGELVMPNVQVYDSAITADGAFAMLATSPLVIIHEDAGASGLLAQETMPVQPMWRDACGNEFGGPEDDLPLVSGTVLVDIRDPTNPTIADFESGPAIGPHSVSSTRIGGVDYVASSTTNLVHTASYFEFFTVEVLPGLDQGQLVPYATFQDAYDTGIVAGGPNAAPLALINGHVDATVAEHPVTGQLLAYLANWEGGLTVADISVPGVAIPLSNWGAACTDTGASSGSIHTAFPLPEMWGERVILVTGQEVGASFDNEAGRRPTGQVVMLDVTDPATPTPLARWTLPVWMEWSGNLHFSTHYVTMVGQTLFVALYHGGVWAADASEANWPELPSTGVFIPAEDPPEGTRTDLAYTPYVLDVLDTGDGNLLIFDSTTGAYMVQYDPTVDVPTADPWLEDAWIG